MNLIKKYEKKKLRYETQLSQMSDDRKEDTEDVLDNYLKPFDMVINRYYPNNMIKEEFNKFLEEIGYSKSVS